ncbi:rhomboid family intramembrane serine protease [Actinopolymorpha sp. NPDC004070]|uniref:rhomboid family intramembrane serine protease n=1 Tax=Actinopolymorpha sp. NPDC004070 TaxID=3154548 RepID=UPI0033BEF9E2
MAFETSRWSDRRGSGRAPDPGVTGLKALIGLIGLMWVSEMADLMLGHHLDGYGIQARETEGLLGIAFAPFLHAGFGHLISNTIPLLMLGAIIAVAGAARLLLVTGLIALVSGLGTWLTSPPGSVTIGASGVVFGYATYLIARGVFSRSLGQLLIGLVVILVWGGALLGGLLPQAGISWQGHLFGAIGGVLTAGLLSEARRHPPTVASYRG